MSETETKRRGLSPIFIAPLIILLFAGVYFAGLPPFGRLYRIPSASMSPTLVPGDYILARPSGRELSLGDVVVHEGDDGRSYIRRVVGLPGDTIGFEGGAPVINGVRATWQEQGIVDGEYQPVRRIRETLPNGRSYLIELQAEGTSPAPRDLPAFEVPEGRIVLVGDARDNSDDARLRGAYQLDSVRHRARYILFSPEPRRAFDAVE